MCTQWPENAGRAAVERPHRARVTSGKYYLAFHDPTSVTCVPLGEYRILFKKWGLRTESHRDSKRIRNFQALCQKEENLGTQPLSTACCFDHVTNLDLRGISKRKQSNTVVCSVSLSSRRAAARQKSLSEQKAVACLDSAFLQQQQGREDSAVQKFFQKTGRLLHEISTLRGGGADFPCSWCDRST